MEFNALTIPIPKQPWRWIRFRIGTILLLIAIFALILAWRRDHQQLTAEVSRLQISNRRYEAVQATGAPDSFQPGDSSSAWCPATMDGGSEWMLLDYDKSVVPTAVVLHENFVPGAVVRITYFTFFGKEKTLWEGTYSSVLGKSGNVATLPVTAGVKLNRIKVYLDTAAAPGWNEVDAVGLVHGKNEVIWAGAAEASSTWGQMETNEQSQSNWAIRQSKLLE